MLRPSLLFVTLAACTATPIPKLDPDLVGTPTARVVASLQRTPHDPAHHLDTCKVFHHVFAPDGRLLTKGLGGEFEHHRGLFLGWNQLQWRGARYDFWHCSHGETQQFRRFVPAAELGLDDHWQVVAIEWCDGKSTAIVDERRAVRAHELDPTTTVLDVQSELRAVDTAVRLAGDPQHSGQQLRALQQFAEPAGPKVRYVRPEGATGSKDDLWTNCEWTAAVLPMTGGEVTVLRIEGSKNPRPGTWSTRPYGRFGATFTTELAPGEPQTFAWTYVIALGERDADWCERTAAAVVR